ncbi:biotin/lipoyl-binding protein [uncultured Eubacterium sp.]|uniref:HlyD family efflux transporter periplasmic adaptor subunit n=1 Tax=uncultured Eubacterium sp. TaxID=165185 RepID=UPI0028052F6E|nr:biotin/lipoyl-binding protein [uncultured Eubacterium sp.]
MATVKKSNTKKIVWAVIAVILVVAIVITSVVFAKNGKKTEVTLNTVSTNSITQTVSSTGQVSSGLKKEYKPGTVATVKKVYVEVGDKVKKGDQLAVFDTSSLDSQVASLNSAYANSNASYQEAVQHQAEAAKSLASINKSIAKTEKRLKKLEKGQEKKTTTATTKKPVTTTTTTTTTTIRNWGSVPQATSTTVSTTACTHDFSDHKFVDSNYSGHYKVCKKCGTKVFEEHHYGSVQKFASGKDKENYHYYKCADCGYIKKEVHDFQSGVGTVTCKICGDAKVSGFNETSAMIELALEQLQPVFDSLKQLGEASKQIVDLLQSLVKDLSNIAKDVDSLTRTITIVADTILYQISSGNWSAEKIADAVGKAVTAAIKQGMIEFIDSGAAVKMIETAVKSVDWKAIGRGIAETENFGLASAQVQLAALYAQKEVYTVTAAASTVNAQKQAAAAAKNAYEVTKAARDDLAKGWKAEFSGVITTCDIEEGGQTTALSTGLTLENMKKRVVTISLGEYDVHKVKEGMAATVKTAYGTYDGVVASIAPTATGASQGSMLDSVGSMAGISGLSSLTNSGAGVECKVVVDHPDENIIVGFDADVEIVTGTYTDVPCVPIESIVLEKEGTYVYLYNPEEETVTKTKIETGATSDTSYEIKSGLSIGDQIVATPQTDYEEDSFKVKVKTDKTK